MGNEHFDATAQDWDRDEAKVAQAARVAQAVAAAVPLDRAMRVLEYGAGTGLVTQALGDRVGPATLADSSAGMREVLGAKVADGSLAGGRVWDLDLERQPAPADRFDLVVCSNVLHHVRRLEQVLDGLTTLLAPGGYLCIADLDQEDGSFHGHDFDGHHGFSRPELAAQLTAAGLTDVTVGDGTWLDREGVIYQVFLAVARRT